MFISIACNVNKEKMALPLNSDIEGQIVWNLIISNKILFWFSLLVLFFNFMGYWSPYPRFGNYTLLLGGGEEKKIISA